jgi:hypothetical protein
MAPAALVGENQNCTAGHLVHLGVSVGLLVVRTYLRFFAGRCMIWVATDCRPKLTGLWSSSDGGRKRVVLYCHLPYDVPGSFFIRQ